MLNYLLKVNHCKLFGKLFVEGQGAVARCGEGMKWEAAQRPRGEEMQIAFLKTKYITTVRLGKKSWRVVRNKAGKAD